MARQRARSSQTDQHRMDARRPSLSEVGELADSISGYSYYAMPDVNYDSLSGSINFTGLGSGTDFSAIVDQLVEIESIQKTRLETWKATWEAKVDSMKALNQRMMAIEEAAGAMDTESEFLVRQASTSNSSVLSATASNDAATGAYTITVGTDVVHILSSAGVASATSDVVTGAGGEMELYIAGSLTTIMVGATDSLGDIADAINAKVAGVATVEDDGTGSRAYHLQLKSTTGGRDGRIVVTKNPTDLSFDYKDMALKEDTDWGIGATQGPEIGLAGQFFGDKSTSSLYDYVFTVSSGGSSVGVGTDAFDLVYQVLDETGTTIVGATTISLSTTYGPGDSIEVDNGMFLQLGTGRMEDGDSFTVRGYANDVDDAEQISWTGSTISTSGNYLGPVSKTYSFTVVSGGALDDAGSGDTVTLRWTDSTGRTGTVSLSQSNYAYEVEQGIKISLGSGSVASSDTFQVNVFAADQQQGQDKGLAQACKVVHDGFADPDITAVTTSDATFNYTYMGEQISVAVGAGTTLSQLVTTINLDSDNPGVTASIINDGMGLPNSYKLVLTGDNAGAPLQITDVNHDFSGSNFANGGDVGGGFTLTQRATNSMVKVDGFPADDDVYLQRATNQITGVVDGVTVNLHDSGTAVVSVSNDVDSVYAKIESLINAVNYAQSFIRTETKFDPDGEETGVLIGNYSYYILKSRIDSALNTRVSGLIDGTDPYIHLGQIGIHTDPDSDGAWVIESATLRNALNSNLEAVANLFIANEAKSSTGVAKRTYDEMDALTDSESGTLNVLMANYNQIIANLDKKITSEESRIALYEERQLERFARLEAALSELNGQSSALESAIAQLPNSSS